MSTRAISPWRQTRVTQPATSPVSTNCCIAVRVRSRRVALNPASDIQISLLWSHSLSTTFKHAGNVTPREVLPRLVTPLQSAGNQYVNMLRILIFKQASNSIRGGVKVGEVGKWLGALGIAGPVGVRWMRPNQPGYASKTRGCGLQRRFFRLPALDAEYPFRFADDSFATPR